MRLGTYLRIPAVVARNPDLTPTAKLVYGAMLAYQGKHPSCIASCQRIADRLAVSKRSVIDAIAQLHRAYCIRPAEHTEAVQPHRGGYGNSPTGAWVCLHTISTGEKSAPVKHARPVKNLHRDR